MLDQLLNEIDSHPQKQEATTNGHDVPDGAVTVIRNPGGLPLRITLEDGTRQVEVLSHWDINAILAFKDEDEANDCLSMLMEEFPQHRDEMKSQEVIGYSDLIQSVRDHKLTMCDNPEPHECITMNDPVVMWDGLAPS